MYIANQKNFFAGLFYIAFGLAVAIMASGYDIGSATSMGPGYFPFGVGLLLVLTGTVVLVAALGRHPDSEGIGALALKKTGIILLAVVLFGLLLQPLGLVVAVPVLIGVSALAHHEFSWRTVLVVIGLMVPGVWAIFVALLGLPIPFWPRGLF